MHTCPIFKAKFQVPEVSGQKIILVIGPEDNILSRAIHLSYGLHQCMACICHLQGLDFFLSNFNSSFASP